MKILIASIMAIIVSAPAYASSLPDADITQKIGIGTGPSVSFDFRVNPKTSLGVSIGSPFYRGFFLSGSYDLRLLHKFVDQNKLAVSGLIGLAGDQAFSNLLGSAPIGVEAGIALSYQFIPKLTGRLNIVGTIPIYRSGAINYFSYVAPASGIEIGYKFSPNIEATLGGNGQGDVLGLNIIF